MFYLCSKNKGAESLICVFVFACPAKNRFSHFLAHIIFHRFGRTDGESLMDYKILWFFVSGELNPLVTNKLSHPYHLDKSIFIFRDIRSNFSFIFR